jgi:uncharacterized membrane protein
LFPLAGGFALLGFRGSFPNRGSLRFNPPAARDGGRVFPFIAVRHAAYSFQTQLFGLLVQSMLPAKLAVLGHLKPVGVVFLVLLGVVVALFSHHTGQSNFHTPTDNGTSC